MSSSVFILGARGSVPVSRQNTLSYEGATLCIFMRLAGQPVGLDAGTGILDLPRVLSTVETEIPVLLSPPRTNHLLGLPMYPRLFEMNRSLHIYAAERCGMTGEEMLCSLISPPLWPVGPTEVGAAVKFHTMESSFQLGSVHVKTMDRVHPGGVTLFRLSGGGKTVVYITDCALTENLFPRVTAFAEEVEPLVNALASQTAISLTNMQYADRAQSLLDSRVRAMSTAIDEPTPYNANHSRNMACYAATFLDWLKRTGNHWKFYPDQRREFLLSVWLHEVEVHYF